LGGGRTTRRLFFMCPDRSEQAAIRTVVLRHRIRGVRITRREFVDGAIATGLVADAPAILRGRNLNHKLDMAFIACGGRGLANLVELTITSGAGLRSRGTRTKTSPCGATSIR
jgi:hypothetical protein